MEFLHQVDVHQSNCINPVRDEISVEKLYNPKFNMHGAP